MVYSSLFCANKWTQIYSNRCRPHLHFKPGIKLFDEDVLLRFDINRRHICIQPYLVLVLFQIMEYKSNQLWKMRRPEWNQTEAFSRFLLCWPITRLSVQTNSKLFFITTDLLFTTITIKQRRSPSENAFVMHYDSYFKDLSTWSEQKTESSSFQLHHCVAFWYKYTQSGKNRRTE